MTHYVQRSPEFTLLLDCCKAAFTGEAVTPPRGIDWPRFIALARFHRVQGFAWEALATKAPKGAVTLAEDANAIALGNLRSASECMGLRNAFADAGVPLLFVKGLTLGTIAYGRATAKAASDIDLLVPEDALDRTLALLGECGFGPILPAKVNATTLERWHRRRKESVFAKGSLPLIVDVHTRLADNAAMIPTIGLKSPRQSVEVAKGVTLETLATDELFAYLAVHGASSAWFRVKWISDFAALVHGKNAGEIERLYRWSLKLGAGRAPAQALLLADTLFGTLADAPALKAELESSRAARRLARMALRQVTGEAAEPTQRRFGTARIHVSQLWLRPGLAFKAGEVLRQLRASGE